MIELGGTSFWGVSCDKKGWLGISEAIGIGPVYGIGRAYVDPAEKVIDC